MSILNDQFSGGIDPLQNHRDLGFLETRQVRYAVRVTDYDAYGRPVVDADSVGDVLCASHWGPSSREIGGWAGVWPVKGGSPVSTSKFSSTGKLQEQVGLAQKAANSQFRGRGGGYVTTKDGQQVAYLQIGIGLDPGGFDTLGGTGRSRTFGLPNGYAFGIDLQPNLLDNNAQLVIYDGPTVSYKNGSGSQASGRGRGNVGGGGNKGAPGPMGAAGVAGANAFAPGGAFGGNGRVVTGESGAAGGSIAVRPIKNSAYSQDNTFGSGNVNTPEGWPSLVDGSVGVVLAGTEHKRQEPVYIHGDPRMVAVNNGADPSASSIVYDTDGSGRFDFYRKARLHSAWRVLPPFAGSPAFGPGGTLAWQLASGERDMVAGYGAVIDTSSTQGKQKVTTTTTPSPSSPSTAVAQAAGELATSIGRALSIAGNSGAGYYAALGAFQKSQAKAVPVNNGNGLANANAGARAAVAGGLPALTVGLTSRSLGGFIEVGHATRDKHVHGKSGEHNINSAHVSVDALFYRDEEADAPVNFELDYYPGADSFPLRSKVHLQYNPNVNHNVSVRTLDASTGGNIAARKFKGRWDLWAEVPNTKEGGGEVPPPGLTPPEDPPPPTTPVPPPTTVSRWRERLTVGGLPALGFGWGGGFRTGGIGGAGGGAGGGSYGGAGSDDLPTEPPLQSVLARAPARGKGGTYQMTDEVESFVKVPGLEPARVGGGLTADRIPQSRLDTVRTRDGVTERTDQFSGFPAATAHTVILFRPQHTSRGYRDLRNAVSAPESTIKRQMADRPMTLRMEAFGSQYGETWVKTQKAGMSRFDAGTGNGGVVYLPPELDLLDVERATYVPTASTSYIVAHPGVYWAAGYARVGSGDVKTGYRWGTDSTGILTFSTMSSTGAASTAFGANASGRLFFTESAGTTLTVGSITDGSILRRSGTSIIGASASVSSPLVYGDGSIPAGNTIAGTASATAFASAYTIPANRLVLGSLIEVDLYGILGTDVAGPTLVLGIRVGGVVFVGTAAVTLTGSMTALVWHMRARMLVTAAGAGGTAECHGDASVPTSSTAAQSVPCWNTSPLAVDTTATQVVDAQAQWGTSSASNTITLHLMTVKITDPA